MLLLSSYLGWCELAIYPPPLDATFRTRERTPPLPPPPPGTDGTVERDSDRLRACASVYTPGTKCITELQW